MKLNMASVRRLTLTAGVAVTFSACEGINLSGAEQALQQQNGEDAAAGENDEYQTHLLAGDEADSEDSTDGGEDVKERKGHAVFETARQLSRAIDLQVAECGGFGDEATALIAKMDELRAAKSDPRESKDEIEPLREALQTALEANADKITACLVTAKESDEGVALSNLVGTCFASGPGVGRPGHGKGHGGPGRERPRKVRPEGEDGEMRANDEGGDRPHFRFPPPPPMAAFGSLSCQAAMVAAQDLLGIDTSEYENSDDANASEEDIAANEEE